LHGLVLYGLVCAPLAWPPAELIAGLFPSYDEPALSVGQTESTRNRSSNPVLRAALELASKADAEFEAFGAKITYSDSLGRPLTDCKNVWPTR
jgi:hypothetical protein